MDITKMPKFQEDRNDGENIGHDENEWGKQREIKKIEIIEAYDLKWNKNKNNKRKPKKIKSFSNFLIQKQEDR